MKISKQHREYIASAIAEHDKNRDLAIHERQYKSMGLSPKRFRWDCLHGCALSRWICDNIYRDGAGDYTGINDSHIDTVLRGVMRELGLDWASQ